MLAPREGSGATGQPAAADGEAFAGSLRDAAAKLLSASESDGASGEAALALLDAGGDRPLTGEASDALRNALEALAGSRLKTGDGDDLPAQKAPLAELADAGVSEENAIRDLVEHAADNGAANPMTGGLAVPAPLTAAASKNTAQALPVMRAPDALNRPATVSALPADGAVDSSGLVTGLTRGCTRVVWSPPRRRAAILADVASSRSTLRMRLMLSSRLLVSG